MNRRNIATLFVVGLLGGSVSPAAAHGDPKVTICIPSYPGGPCFKSPSGTSYEGEGGPSYLYGQGVPVKGKVGPKHKGRVEIQRRKAPDYEIRRHMPDFPLPLWETVAEVRLNEEGVYRYVWKTARGDADQGNPYQFRVILPGHIVSSRQGTSRIQEVYVLYGE